MVQTRRGVMKEKMGEVGEGERASNPAEKPSNPAEKASIGADEALNAADEASISAVVASITGEKASITAAEASSTAEKASMAKDEASTAEKASIIDDVEGGARVTETTSPVVEEAEERDRVLEPREEEKEEDNEEEEKEEEQEKEKEKDGEKEAEERDRVLVPEPTEEEKEEDKEEEEKEEEQEKEKEKDGEKEAEERDWALVLVPEPTEEEKEEDKEVEEIEEEQEEEKKAENYESDEEPVAMEPLGMYFTPSEYNKKIKISTRCHNVDTVYKMKHLEAPMNAVETDWFENHPQFKHILHMPAEDNHKVMGIWMLLLRTARIEKKKEFWFVVNGVPIRYSIREHALISGLDCRNYPLNYEKAGSERFKERHFKGIAKIRLQDVREKLEGMKPGRSNERLKMLVLYFLCTIIVGWKKNSGKLATPVDKFLLRAVDDLEFCTNFPWGRYSFDYMLRMISHTLRHFKGVVPKEGILWPVPGFCIPLEFLAFEAIPALGRECIEEIPESDAACPRMCRIRFKKSLLKGWTLGEIYELLGTTTAIDSVIPAIGQEKHLLKDIMDEGEEDDVPDVVVDTWMRRLRIGLQVSFEDMYNADVDSRLPQANVEEENEPRVDNIELMDLLNNMNDKMQQQLDTVLEKVNGIETRLEVLETNVDELQFASWKAQADASLASPSTSKAEDGSGEKKKKKKKKKNEKKKTEKRASETDITPHEKSKKKKRV